MTVIEERELENVSLSVQKSNPAARLYRRIEFEQIGSAMGETEEELIMVCSL